MQRSRQQEAPPKHHGKGSREAQALERCAATSCLHPSCPCPRSTSQAGGEEAPAAQRLQELLTRTKWKGLSTSMKSSLHSSMKRASFRRLFILEFTSCSLGRRGRVPQPRQEGVCAPVSKRAVGEVPKHSAGEQGQGRKGSSGKDPGFRAQTSHILAPAMLGHTLAEGTNDPQGLGPL